MINDLRPTSQVGILLAVLFIIHISYFILPGSARADNMTSSSYKLLFSNLNITSGEKNSASYNLTDTVGQTGAGQYGLGNQVVKSGFQYIYPLERFSFKVSPLLVNLGSLTINFFSQAEQYLEVTSVGAGGYTVTVSQSHPLSLQTNPLVTIPDTPCNATCSHTTAGVWTDSTRHGFGYYVTGHDVVPGFTDNTYFKQFADLSTLEIPQAIMTSSDAGSHRQSVLTYKIAIGGQQDAGTYETAINYTAIPGY